jgi:hypothetical protein
MSDKAFSAEEAILVARAAGLDTSALEAQVKRQAEGHDVETLASRVAELEAKLEVQQSPPQDPRREFAEGYARALRKAQSEWFSPTDEGGTDAAA